MFYILPAPPIKPRSNIIEKAVVGSHKSTVGRLRNHNMVMDTSLDSKLLSITWKKDPLAEKE